MSELPTTMKTHVNIKALHNAMPSALEGTFEEPGAFFRLALAVDVDVLFIVRF